MVRDLSDKTQVQRQIASRQRRTQAATRQQDMAVDRGAFTVKSEEGLRVGTPDDPTGSQVVYGALKIIGDLIGEGSIEWEGTADLRGPVHITGENGTLTVDAETVLQGLVTLLESLIVRAPGKITVEGTDPIVLEQEGGQAKIKVGSVGEIAGSESGIQMMIEGETVRRIVLTPSGFKFVGVTTGAADETPDFWLGSKFDGTVRRYPAGSGGPMGGDFDWPFDLSLVTSEFGMRVHPVTGVETMHNGIDFGGPAGVAIPAASRGTVIAVGTDGGRGNYVVLSHPNNVETHYFHMQSTPPVSMNQVVSKGYTLGQIGSTGLSTAPHLHFEVHVNGTPINPRSFAGLES